MVCPIRYDSREVLIHGKEADRATRTIINRFNATIPFTVFGTIREIEGKQATYIPPDHPTAPLKGGWLIRGATLTPPLEPELLEPGASILTQVNDAKGFPRPWGDPPLARRRDLLPQVDAVVQGDDAEAELVPVRVDGRAARRPRGPGQRGDGARRYHHLSSTSGCSGRSWR